MKQASVSSGNCVAVSPSLNRSRLQPLTREIIRQKLIYNQIFKSANCVVSCRSDDDFKIIVLWPRQPEFSYRWRGAKKAKFCGAYIPEGDAFLI